MIIVYGAVTPERDASVAPAAPPGTHQVRSPIMPSTDMPRSDRAAFDGASMRAERPSVPRSAAGFLHGIRL